LKGAGRRAWNRLKTRASPEWRILTAIVVTVTVASAGLVFAIASDSPTPLVEASRYTPPPPPPPPDPDTIFLTWGPSEGDMIRAIETAQAMTVEEAAGQVIISSFSGMDGAALQALITQYHLGGVIFSRANGNISTREQTAALASAAQAASVADGRDWPVIISTDQEGGTVARLDGLIPTMPSFMAAGAAHDKEVVEAAFAGMGRDMAALGFNVDFAPVADLTIGLADPVIRSRSAGSDPENVSETVVAAVAGLVDSGVIPAVKHYPGHGGVTTDSHALTPINSRPLADLEDTDLVPFGEAIDAGAPMVMMSHVAVTVWSGIPASLDPLAYAYLREDLGFTGVTVTDGMDMGGVTAYGSTGATTVAALNAGADIVLMSANTAEAHAAIIAAVADGSLSRDRLDEAAARVVALMRYQASIDPAVSVEGDYVRELSRNSVTVVAPLCGRPLVGSQVTISGGWPGERAALAAALAEYGVTTGSSGTSIRLLGRPDGTGTADVVVAMDGPWGLSSSQATSYIGLYGRGASSFAALADILTGAVVAEGQWPVSVPGLPFNACPSPR